MAYALFEDSERLTRIFATEQEVWAMAERAGLVETMADGTRVLDDNLEIRFCPGEPQEGEDLGMDFNIY